MSSDIDALIHHAKGEAIENSKRDAHLFVGPVAFADVLFVLEQALENLLGRVLCDRAWATC